MNRRASIDGESLFWCVVALSVAAVLCTGLICETVEHMHKATPTASEKP